MPSFLTDTDVDLKTHPIEFQDREHITVPQLADKIAALMEAHNVSLTDLLVGLADEREAIWRERQQDA